MTDVEAPMRYLATTGGPAAPPPGVLFNAALRAAAAGHPAHLVVHYRSSSWPAPVQRWYDPADTTDLSALDRLDRTLVGGADVLDSGCGPGRHAVVLHGRGHRVLGVDSSRQAVELARRRGAPALRADALGPLPGAHAGWDAVLLLDGNIGIGGDPLLLLCRVRDLLRPDGRVLIELDPDGHSDRGRAHLSTGRHTGAAFAWARLDGAGLAAMAACAGLHVQSVWTSAARRFALLSAEPR